MDTDHTPSDAPGARRGDLLVASAAAVGGFASVAAWAACCVLPLALSVAGVSFAGAALLAGARHWLTLLAVAIVAAGWAWHLRRWARARRDGCARPRPLAFGLLLAATLLIGLALLWQPVIEPWAMPRLAALR